MQQKHLDKIETFKSYSDLNRWDKISAEYSTLQNMYEAIANSDAAAKLVKANSYQKQIDSVKQAAAEDYYQIGLSYLQRHSRDDAKLAYSAFKKAGKWVNDYKTKGLAGLSIKPGRGRKHRLFSPGGRGTVLANSRNQNDGSTKPRTVW